MVLCCKWNIGFWFTLHLTLATCNTFFIIYRSIEDTASFSFSTLCFVCWGIKRHSKGAPVWCLTASAGTEVLGRTSSTPSWSGTGWLGHVLVLSQVKLLSGHTTIKGSHTNKQDIQRIDTAIGVSFLAPGAPGQPCMEPLRGSDRTKGYIDVLSSSSCGNKWGVCVSLVPLNGFLVQQLYV